MQQSCPDPGLQTMRHRSKWRSSFAALARVRRRVAAEPGAAAVEFAIGALLLITLLFGAGEFGLLLQKEHTVASAVRSGARIASSTCLDMSNADTGVLSGPASTSSRFRCEKGNREVDDFFVIAGLRASLRGYWGEVESIRIYRIPQGSIAKGDGKPPTVCDTSTSGVTTWCNVYTKNTTFTEAPKGTIPLLTNLEDFYYDAADHTADATHKVGQVDQDLVADTFNCQTGPSRFFCPTGKTPSGQYYRVRNLNSPSNLGVYVQLRHGYITGLFGVGRNVAQWASFRLEPHPLANDPIPPCPSPCTFEIPPNGDTDLKVIKTVDKTVAKPGDVLTYTVQVKNLGPKAATARFVDEIPNILTLTQPWTCTASGGADCGLQATSKSGLT